MKRILACMVILSAFNCQTKSNTCCGIPQIQVGINNIQNRQSHILNLVNTILENLPSTACGATPITAATTITAPGNYCIANDITGNITISIANVTLNFNGFALTGALTISGSNTQVYNGAIVGTGSGNGILISDSISDVHIFNMDISGTSRGINANTNTNLIISQVMSHNNILDGAVLSNQTNLVVKDSIFSFQNDPLNGFYGLEISFSTNVLIQNCVFANNAVYGFADQGNNSNIVLQNCVAYQNNTFGGFLIASNGTLLTECAALNNKIGFQLRSPGQVSLLNCTAMHNTAQGFAINSSSPGAQILFWLENCISNNNAIGFNQQVTAGNAIGTFKSCSAGNNSGCGFNDVAGSTVSYVSNYSANNGSNYCVNGSAVIPPTTAPYNYVTPPAGATYWDNVSPV